MQDIFFDNIKMTNVRCHEEMAMDFPIGRFNAIIGKNGRGKSTILKALSLALYGDDGDGNRVAEMLNKKIGKDLSVIFNFRVIENDIEDSYRIELYYKCKGNSNNLYLYKNDVDISGKTKTDTYNMIENIYIPKTVHHNSVYFAQQIKDFFTALTNSAQKDIFNAILMLDEWDQKYNKCDLKISQVEAEISSFNTRSIQLDSLIPEKESNLKSKLVEKEVKIKEVSEEIQKFTLILNSQVEKIFELENSKEVVLSNIDEFKDISNIINRLIVDKHKLEQEFLDLTKKCEDEKILISNSVDNERNIKLSDGRIIITEKYAKEKDSANINLKSILEERSKVHEKFSCDDLLKDKHDFETSKRTEQKFLDNEIYKLDSESGVNDLQRDKDQRIKSLQSKKDNISNHANIVKNEAEVLKSTIAILNDAIVKDQSELSKDDAFCDKCGQVLGKQQRDKISADLETKIIQIDESKKKLEDKKIEFLAIKSDYDEISRLILTEESNFNDSIYEAKKKLDNKKSELNRKKTLIEREISEYSDQISTKVELRKAEEVSESQSYTNKIVEIESSIQKLSQSLDNEISELVDRVTKETLLKKQEQINDIIPKYEIERKDKILRIKSIESQIDEKNSDNLKLIDLQKELKSLDIDLATLENSKKVTKDNIDKLNSWNFDNKEIIEIENSITILNLEKNNMDSEIAKKVNKLNMLKFWKEGFSDRGIKSMLIDSAIPLMNRVCRDELEKVSGGKFIVSFDTLSQNKSGDIKDKFAVHVMNCETGADDHKLLSGGEKRLVDLCCMKAIRALQENQYQKRIHATFFDEALDALDDDNSEIFCRLMKQMSSNQNVTIITHKMLQSMEADQVYKL